MAADPIGCESLSHRNALTVPSLVLSISLTGFLFAPGIASLVSEWSRPEYSHSWLLPACAIYALIALAGNHPRLSLTGSWIGPVVVIAAVLLSLAGYIGAIMDFVYFGLSGVFVGLLVSLGGLPLVRRAWPVLLLFVLMMPLPEVFYLQLSTSLQLVSSRLGAALLNGAGVPVLVEGNIIDLGVYKLQVAEACSGLRYLFALICFGVIMSMVTAGGWLEKLVLIISAIPITLLMNSLRIAVTGILVDRIGIGAAEGFIHLIEGWVVFLGCIGLLFLLATAFSRFSGRREVLGGPCFASREGLAQGLRVLVTADAAKILGVCALVLGAGVGVAHGLPERRGITPVRASLANFPLRLGDWHGQTRPLEKTILAALKADDWFLGDYVPRDRRDEPVNLFIAWYSNQTMGRAHHSPQLCIPGDGWEIVSFAERSIGPLTSPAVVNRAVIQRGTLRAVVYYWFEQRGRRVLGEYAVKWYIFRDGVLHQRTDGALIRLVAPLRPGQALEEADRRLTRFVSAVNERLPAFVPP